MVFLIQATQNRDTLALQLKLDELNRDLKCEKPHRFSGLEWVTGTAYYDKEP